MLFIYYYSLFDCYLMLNKDEYEIRKLPVGYCAAVSLPLQLFRRLRPQADLSEILHLCTAPVSLGPGQVVN